MRYRKIEAGRYSFAPGPLFPTGRIWITWDRSRWTLSVCTSIRMVRVHLPFTKTMASRNDGKSKRLVSSFPDRFHPVRPFSHPSMDSSFSLSVIYFQDIVEGRRRQGGSC